MKIHVLALCTSLAIAVSVVSMVAQARGSSSTYAPKPAKVYSCPGCNTNDHYVAPTVRKNGSQVQGHMQTDGNSTKSDNFTTKGNVNPYTGKKGTKKPSK